ncbi:MAG: phospholipase, partial [Flavobacteriaceae bacterium]|nr:phospholipase [Flavobacteriaceae bacterium]
KFIHVHRSSNDKSKKHPLVVLLHGYGSNENDLFSFQRLFPKNHTIVSFRAPLKVFEGMYAWYEIYFENNVKSFNENTAKNSSDEIVDEIKLICKQYNCDINNITLIGFSQGAILGYSITISNPGLIKNLVALSGYVEEKIIDFKNQKINTSIYISHGESDEVIPYLESKQTLEVLDKNGIKYNYNSFNQGHGVNQENLISFLDWLKGKY